MGEIKNKEELFEKIIGISENVPSLDKSLNNFLNHYDLVSHCYHFYFKHYDFFLDKDRKKIENFLSFGTMALENIISYQKNIEFIKDYLAFSGIGEEIK